MTTRPATLLWMLACVMAIGCGSSDSGAERRQASGSVGGVGMIGVEDGGRVSSNESSTNQAPSSPQAEPPLVAEAEASFRPKNEPNPDLSSYTAPAATGPAMVREKAAVGATGKGNYNPGLITTPVSVYFKAQERLAFDSVTHALNLYDATNSHYPKTEEEFFTGVIAYNNIQLPELPDGHRYVYDVPTHTLMVERPEE